MVLRLLGPCKAIPKIPQECFLPCGVRGRPGEPVFRSHKDPPFPLPIHPTECWWHSSSGCLVMGCLAALCTVLLLLCAQAPFMDAQNPCCSLLFRAPCPSLSAVLPLRCGSALAPALPCPACSRCPPPAAHRGWGRASSSAPCSGCPFRLGAFSSSLPAPKLISSCLKPSRINYLFARLL